MQTHHALGPFTLNFTSTPQPLVTQAHTPRAAAAPPGARSPRRRPPGPPPPPAGCTPPCPLWSGGQPAGQQRHCYRVSRSAAAACTAAGGDESSRRSSTSPPWCTERTLFEANPKPTPRRPTHQLGAQSAQRSGRSGGGQGRDVSEHLLQPRPPALGAVQRHPGIGLQATQGRGMIPRSMGAFKCGGSARRAPA